MEIFPAIDILGGKAVRLTQGDYERSEIFSSRPVEVMRSFKASGARNLHVVDLDGAKNGKTSNFPMIEQLVAEGGLFIEVGGGIRDEERVKNYLNAGADRVILGTAAVKNFDFAAEMAAKYPHKIAVGADAKDGRLAIDGWRTITDIDAFEFCERCVNNGVDTVIFTDISTDGMVSGTNLEAFERLVKINGLNVIASGGISSEDDITALCEIGVHGAIIGKAVYKGLVDLSRAVKLAQGD